MKITVTKYIKQVATLEINNSLTEHAAKQDVLAMAEKVGYFTVETRHKIATSFAKKSSDSPKKSLKKWKPEEDKLLIELFKQDISVSEIAIKLGRSAGAINSRLDKHNQFKELPSDDLIFEKIKAKQPITLNREDPLFRSMIKTVRNAGYKFNADTLTWHPESIL